MTTTSNFYTLYGGNVVRVPVHFLSLPLIFNLHWWLPKHFSFCTAATKFSCFCYNKKMSPLLLIYCSFALFLVELRWPAAHFLFFSVFLCSIFQFVDMTIYLVSLNSLHNTDTETISAFHCLYWLCYKRRVAIQFPAKITSSCIWVTIPLD